MNQGVEPSLLNKLKELSPERVSEVEDFVEFLIAKERREQALARLRAAHAALPPEEISEDEMSGVVKEVKATRSELRAERERAGRT